VGFGAHIAGEQCGGDNPPTLNPPKAPNQSFRIFCGDNVYLSKAPSGQIISIAHQGGKAPGGGVFWHARGPILNNSRQALFVEDLTAAESGHTVRMLEGQTDWVAGVAVTPDGHRTVSTSYDCTLQV